MSNGVPEDSDIRECPVTVPYVKKLTETRWAIKFRLKKEVRLSGLVYRTYDEDIWIPRSKLWLHDRKSAVFVISDKFALEKGLERYIKALEDGKTDER